MVTKTTVSETEILFLLCFETKATWLHSHKKASPVPERLWLEKVNAYSRKERPLLPTVTNCYSKGRPASFRPSETLHKTQRHVCNETLTPKRHRYTHHDKIEENVTNRLSPQRPATLPSHICFPSPQSSPHLSQPFHGEGKAPCSGIRPLGSITQLPSLMHFLARQVWGHVTTQCHPCKLHVLERDLVTKPIQPN